MTLEQQLFALLEQHDLTTVSVGIHKRGDGSAYFTANAHADQGRCTGSDYGAEFTGSAAAAISSAIGKMNALRYPPVVAVEPLQPMELAA